MLNNLFRPNTVDSVLASINTAITQLGDVEAAQRAEVDRRQAEITVATVARDAAVTEVQRAKNVREKLSALIA